MRKVALFLLLMVVASFSYAQIGLGIKGGLNFANLDVSSAQETYDNRTGYHVGAFMKIKITKLAIQPELIYSKQGSNFSSLNFSDLESDLAYVNIPVLLKLYIAAGFNLQAGPQFGFLVSAKQHVLNDNGEYEYRDAKELFKDNDTSLALGIGWDLPFGLVVDARYNLGLTDINNSASSEATKNQVFQISAGLRLGK